jgi:hypothetical protein
MSGRTKSKARPRRASERFSGVVIDLHSNAMRNLMIEQCKTDEGYLTVYGASHAVLLAADVPAAAFPSPGKTESRFDVQKHKDDRYAGSRLRGSVRPTAEGFELEIEWGWVMPYMYGHPAICELARMLLKDVNYWAGGVASPYPAAPIDLVAEDDRAVDYKPRPGAPRPQVSPEFLQQLGDRASELFQWVHANCEVMPGQETAAKQPASPPPGRAWS